MGGAGGSGLINQALGVVQLVDEVVKLARGLQHHLARLKSMPGLARQRLDDVLVEIDKTFTTVDDAVKEHLAAALDPAMIDTDPNILIRLAGPDIPIRVERDRGHCHEIGNIYRTYLRGVLDPLLAGNPQAKAETDQIFDTLSMADSDLFNQLSRVATLLQARANEALKLQLATGAEAAKTALREGGSGLIELRQKLQAAHLALVDVRNEFIKEMATPSGSRS
jgi:dsDNA-binding SOS-regulon protein